MRYIFNICFFLVCCITVSGQVKVSPQEQNQVLQQFNASSSTLISMQCNFLQTKKMKLLRNDMQSKGKMYYVKPNKLRWQYTTPYNYIFILNGNEVHIKSENNSQTVDIQRNKMFRQLSNIILQCITGGHLNDSAVFSVEILKNGSTYLARLIPKKKELQKLYTFIELTFCTDLSMVKSVKMEEKTGDVTTVELQNVKVNAQISETLFKLN